jgi:hypothetical protein
MSGLCGKNGTLSALFSRVVSGHARGQSPGVSRRDTPGSAG